MKLRQRKKQKRKQRQQKKNFVLMRKQLQLYSNSWKPEKITQITKTKLLFQTDEDQIYKNSKYTIS